MNTWKTSLKTVVMAMILLGGNLLIPVDVNAYDGDVDYSAPYLTVDPETGKLVTIDPKAQAQQQSQTQHPTTAPSTSTQTAVAGNNNTNTGSDVMAQGNGADTSTTTATNDQAGTGSLMKPFIVTVILSGIIVLFIVLSRRSKPAKTVGTENNGSSADH